MSIKAKAFMTGVLLCCIISASAQTKLQTGVWRGVLTTSTGNALPFNFEIENINGVPRLYVINGSERLKVTSIKTVGDSVFIRMPLFDSEFKLKQSGSGLSGRWIKHLGTKDAVMQFTAKPHVSWRFFEQGGIPKYNVGGRWSAVFGENPHADTTVGVFTQKGSHVTGTFLTTTGDDRFLDGTVKGDSLYLSCFDGGHAFLFTAKINDNHTLTGGKYFSGYAGLDRWQAVRNNKAELPDAYSLTTLKPGYNKIAFTFKDLNGKPVSLSGPRFKNKVVILQIMGSWCPNCMDETNFFVSSFYPKYHPKGVEIIGLAYERTTDFAKSQRTLKQLKMHFNVPYPLLITGYTPSAGDPQKSLPMLADFKGFPTTIIIDKKGIVRRIHTGFNGPGTGEYYTQFIAEFDKLIGSLLAE